ncbi:unnamed protein product [Musa acuminata subsp. malaccensis]|uniref:(wild Malaysian banana) hypothetical protein n=1 Tax=Musa acuminata subsp. malaccensis TaxID=214687 RepID=A0A804K9L3_MUSAM|nr:PREDICTED: EID1-like F-box protein 3 [Musa acuminata subsp. malaccensis]CAG1832411.1 unnamed protein product [Musa acuminata subsp. malaccensis]
MMERGRKNQKCSSFCNPSMPGATAAATSISGGGDGGGGAYGGDVNAGILDETVLMLVFRSLNWDPHVICVAACVSRRLRAVARRVLFRELCISRAPRMVSALTSGGVAPAGRLGGGWHALAKLLFFCCGCAAPTRFFTPDRAAPGHFVGASRFSKTSGRSFLARRCWGDLLFVSDPCEHPAAGRGGGEDLGAYRGVFRGFMRSRTRAWLIGKQAELETKVRCPYCGARVWSMTAAGLVPRSASKRLGSHEGSLEYFVCVNGHLHGYCWLAHLSTDDDDEEDDGDDTGDDGKHNEEDAERNVEF